MPFSLTFTLFSLALLFPFSTVIRLIFLSWHALQMSKSQLYQVNLPSNFIGILLDSQSWSSHEKYPFFSHFRRLFLHEGHLILDSGSCDSRFALAIEQARRWSPHWYSLMSPWHNSQWTWWSSTWIFLLQNFLINIDANMPRIGNAIESPTMLDFDVDVDDEVNELPPGKIIIRHRIRQNTNNKFYQQILFLLSQIWFFWHQWRTLKLAILS